MSLTLTPADIWGAITRPWLVALSLVLEYGVAPLSALALGHIFRLRPILRVGLTLVACVNGGQASNLCTFIARGDLSISVLMTLSSSLLATVAIPALSKLYLSGVVAVDAGGLAASTAKQVLAPLVAGVVVKACAGRVVGAVEPALSIVGIVALVIIVLGTTSLSADLIKQAWSSTLAPVALFHVFGFWFGFVVALYLFRMRRPVATAVAFESGFKSPALSFVLARRHFDDVEVQTASAVSILVLVPLAMAAAVAFHLCVRPEEPGGADGPSNDATDGAKADVENAVPDVPPLELPMPEVTPVAPETEMNSLPAVTLAEVPTSKSATVTSDKRVNGG
ncbi:hypothetical protein MMPV_004569 [Pyropia vietnamensis]